MNPSRILLYVFGIGFVLLGLQFLALPKQLTIAAGIVLPTGVAVQEIRAVYGGFFLGTGIYLTLSARYDGWTRHGLMALAAIMGGLVLGRGLGFVLDGPANALIYGLFAVEVAGFVTSLALLRATRLRA